MSNYDYVLAKLHGIHAKSIVGENYKKLKQITNIEKLHKELFPDDVEPTTVKRLYNRVEKLFKEKTYKEINDVSKFFNYKNELINNILFGYEIDNVKILINSHLSGLKTVSNFFEIKLKKTLNYKLLYSMDISDFRNIQRLLVNTAFKFILPQIEQRKDIFLIENELDRFYYKSLVESVKNFSDEDKGRILKILREEMNWQNILWGLRTKLYYGKTFNDVKDTFIKSGGLIPLDLIKKIFDLQFIPNEGSRVFRDFPVRYAEVILKSFRDDGDIDLPNLEEGVNNRLAEMYMQYFYIGNNDLPIISYIYIKKKEYYNIVKLVESLRYNLQGEAS